MEEDMKGILAVASDAVMAEKVKVYGSITDLIVDMAGKPDKQSALVAMGRKLSKIGFLLFAVAPDKVVTAYLKWRCLAVAKADAVEIMKAFAELMLEMRRDIEPGTACTVETALDFWG